MNTPDRLAFLVDGIAGMPHHERANIVRRILGFLIDGASIAYVDAFTDCNDLPPNVVEALSVLQGFAPLQRNMLGHRRQTNMSVPIEPADREARSAFLAFAPYSIHAELRDHNDEEIAILDDTSTSIYLRVPTQVVDELRLELPTGTSLRTA